MSLSLPAHFMTILGQLLSEWRDVHSEEVEMQWVRGVENLRWLMSRQQLEMNRLREDSRLV